MIYLEFFSMGELLLGPNLFIYSVTCLYQYRLMDIYIIFQFTIQYYFILLLKLSHLWYLGALSIGTLCVRVGVSECVCVACYFIFWHY